MGIKREEIKGTVILNEIESATIVRSQYDTESKDMIVEFKNGTKYQYNEVPHQTYTKFRMAESQGKYFSSDIANKIKSHVVFCSALHKSNMKSFQSALIKSSGEMSFPNTFAFFFNSAEFKVLEFHFLPALSYCISQKTGGNLKSC